MPAISEGPNYGKDLNKCLSIIQIHKPFSNLMDANNQVNYPKIIITDKGINKNNNFVATIS